MSFKKVPGEPLVKALKRCGFEVIDNRAQSGIIWVIHQKEKKELFAQLAQEYAFEVKVEKLGALITNGRKSWRIMGK